MLPITIILTIVLMYFSQMCFSTFNIAYIIIGLLGLLGVVLTIKNRSFELTAGAVSFIVICAFFILIDLGRGFTRWDELSHWGMMLKEMIRLDSFYTVGESYLIPHKDYPPFIQMFELIWCKFSGGYSEAAALVALHVLIVSILVSPLLETFEIKTLKDKFISAVVVTGLFVTIIQAVFELDMFLTIYQDIVLFALWARAMYLVYSRYTFETFGLVEFILLVCSLPMIKQVGIAFCLMVCFYQLVIVLLSGGKGERKRWIMIIAAFILPLVLQKSWSAYVKKQGVVGQFDLSQISISGIRTIFMDQNSLKFQGLKSYIHAIFQKDIFSNIIHFTVFSSILVIAFLLIVLTLIQKKNRNQDELDLASVQRDNIILGIILTLGTAGYICVMMILYLFCFSDSELANLASFDRYFLSYIVGELLLIAMIFVYELNNSKWLRVSSNTLFTLFVLIMLITMQPERLYNMLPKFGNNNEFREQMEYASIIDANTQEGSVVYIIGDYDSGDLYFTQYYSAGRRMFGASDQFITGDAATEEDKERIKSDIEACDYVFEADSKRIYNADEYLDFIR